MCFGLLAAVDSLDFEVEEGEVFGIAGPNGAGKTTLFNVIAGVYRPTGAVFFENKNITNLRADEVCRRGIARTFQIPQLFHTLSIRDNVRVGAHFGNTDRRRVNDAMEHALTFVGLQGKEGITAGSLNLYDKKLTMLAAAIATTPKLMLLDEPIGGLSPTETRDFVLLVEKVNAELGMTVVVIEHLMKVLTRLSHRMMILENGKKVCVGTPSDVTCDQRVIDCYLGRGNKHA
jgi:branched-chain amino acid transport system ATP-binding protein